MAMIRRHNRCTHKPAISRSAVILLYNVMVVTVLNVSSDYIRNSIERTLDNPIDSTVWYQRNINREEECCGNVHVYQRAPR